MDQVSREKEMKDSTSETIHESPSGWRWWATRRPYPCLSVFENLTVRWREVAGRLPISEYGIARPSLSANLTHERGNPPLLRQVFKYSPFRKRNQIPRRMDSRTNCINQSGSFRRVMDTAEVIDKVKANFTRLLFGLLLWNLFNIPLATRFTKRSFLASLNQQ